MSKHTARRQYIQHQWNKLENTALEQGRFEDYDEYEYIMLKRLKKWRRGMREWIYDTYNSVMGWEKNPLRHIKDFNTRHLVTQVHGVVINTQLVTEKQQAHACTWPEHTFIISHGLIALGID